MEAYKDLYMETRATECDVHNVKGTLLWVEGHKIFVRRPDKDLLLSSGPCACLTKQEVAYIKRILALDSSLFHVKEECICIDLSTDPLTNHLTDSSEGPSIEG